VVVLWDCLSECGGKSLTRRNVRLPKYVGLAGASGVTRKVKKQITFWN